MSFCRFTAVEVWKSKRTQKAAGGEEKKKKKKVLLLVARSACSKDNKKGVFSS